MRHDPRRDHLCSLPAETTARKAALSWLREQRRAPESERLLTALRLRGFLCIPAPDGDGVFLSPSHAGDLRLLQQVVLLEPLEDHSEWGWRVRGAGRLKRLFPRKLDEPKGLTAVGYEAHTVGSAITYRNMHHGVRAMLAPLDVGVALLVRALPLVGVATWDSCDGHAQKNASIDVCTAWDAVWLETVLQVVSSRAVLWQTMPPFSPQQSLFAPTWEQLTACAPALQPACRWTVSMPDRRLCIRPGTAHSGAELLHDTWAVAATADPAGARLVRVPGRVGHGA